jgi:hypothetical protein
MVLQAFESPWPLIQANAAYFAGCLLSELSDTRALAVYLPKVLTSLLPEWVLVQRIWLWVLICLFFCFN